MGASPSQTMESTKPLDPAAVARVLALCTEGASSGREWCEVAIATTRAGLILEASKALGRQPAVVVAGARAGAQTARSWALCRRLGFSFVTLQIADASLELSVHARGRRGGGPYALSASFAPEDWAVGALRRLPGIVRGTFRAHGEGADARLRTLEDVRASERFLRRYCGGRFDAAAFGVRIAGEQVTERSLRHAGADIDLPETHSRDWFEMPGPYSVLARRPLSIVKRLVGIGPVFTQLAGTLTDTAELTLNDARARGEELSEIPARVTLSLVWGRWSVRWSHEGALRPRQLASLRSVLEDAVGQRLKVDTLSASQAKARAREVQRLLAKFAALS